MKVPIQYKSSDRYNAGVDVIYDDESKLQYAPFIYAGTQSGDNGPDDGGDEEGEDSMIITYDETNSRYDKTWQEAVDAFNSGKTVVVKIQETTVTKVWYLVQILPEQADAPAEYKYGLVFWTLGGSQVQTEIAVKMIASATPTAYLVNVENA